MSKKNKDLGSGNIGRLLFSLAIPAIIAQIVNLLYNIVDRIFIGRMPDGQLAMAGVGIVMPIILLVSAFSFLIGMGGGPLAAIKMGEKNNEAAEEIMGNGFCMALIIGAVVTIVISIFKEPLVIAFGASENTLRYAVEYLSIYLIGTIFIMIAVGMNSFINTQGFTSVGMMTVVIGAVLNIFLDPVFIFTLDLGVKGAALATIISQLISAAFVVKFLFGKKTVIRIRKKYMKLNKDVVFSILALGVSPFIMQFTESAVLISLNNQLSRYGGDLAVSAMTIISSILQCFMMINMGLIQGAQPIISYNFGAKNYDRVRRAFRLLITCSLIFTCTLTAMIIINPEMFVRAFSEDKELIEITAWSMRIYFAAIFTYGALMPCQQTFLALGQAKISLVLSILRKIGLLVPLVFILPALMPQNGLFAVLLAEPVADIVAGAITVGMFFRFYKKTFMDVQKAA